jgi:tRNA pseudouridine38-40 synthase
MQFRLLVEYDGGGFAGWQIQPDERTVQGEIEIALATLLGHEARARAAGRTDSGVHACGQVVCFRTHREISPEVVCRALNALLGGDVAVRSVEVVGDDFDPRRSALSRSYEYRIWNRRVRSPFWRNHAWHVVQPLDDAAMQRAAAHLIGEHDFTSLRAAGCDAGNPVRRVTTSDLAASPAGMLVYRVTATAFLRHMVRNIVGTLVEIGRSRRSADDLPALLAARDRTLAGATAPPHGLCLVRVDYPD